jgi:hypothetical protein
VTMTLERKDLTIDQQRWCADWLLQMMWAVENDVESPTNLYVPHRSTNPRTKGTYDPKDGKIDTALKLLSPYLEQPELWAYTCYIPPQDALEFPGAKVYLYPEEVPQIGLRLQREGLFGLWHKYKEGGTWQVFMYHRYLKAMVLTPKARITPGIEALAMVLYGFFESEIVRSVNTFELEMELWPSRTA